LKIYEFPGFYLFPFSEQNLAKKSANYWFFTEEISFGRPHNDLNDRISHYAR